MINFLCLIGIHKPTRRLGNHYYGEIIVFCERCGKILSKYYP